jgi:hypothetical protein
MWMFVVGAISRHSSHLYGRHKVVGVPTIDQPGIILTIVIRKIMTDDFLSYHGLRGQRKGRVDSQLQFNATAKNLNASLQ